MDDIDKIVVVIGSKALAHYVDIGRTPVDTDYIMTYNMFQRYIKDCIKFDKVKPQYYPISNGKKYVCKRVVNGKQQIDEIEIAWEGSTAEELFHIVLNDPKTIAYNVKQMGVTTTAFVEAFLVPSLDILYTLKMSHRFLKNSPHFLKTMKDIQMLRTKFAAEIVYPEWFKRREKETYEYKHPALNVKKNDFFKDETFYKYDHDDIHEAIKIFEKPAYTYILADGEQVKCSKEKFYQLPYHYQLACAVEEVIVLTLERGLIPNDFKVDADKMFRVAAMKVCTSITSGWFREFCWEHYDEIVDAIEHDLNQSWGNFIERFANALNFGQIRDFSHDRKQTY